MWDNERLTPYARPGHWFKGSLHVHSTLSDGDLAPEEVLEWYHARGYHFVALTDHNLLSPARTLAADCIAVSGIEFDGVDPAFGFYHLLGLGLEAMPNLEGRLELPIREAVNRLRGAGGRVCIAHPYWSGQMSKDLVGLEGCFGLEIYNGGCEVLESKGLSVVHWDDLLAAGTYLWGLAVDDAHWRPGPVDAGLGWVWVRAAELSQSAVLDALERGLFYASTGPEIYDFRVDFERREVHLRCSPSTVIDIIGNGRHAKRFLAPPGERLTDLTAPLSDHHRYVRIACQDERGTWAWSNPIRLPDRR